MKTLVTIAALALCASCVTAGDLRKMEAALGGAVTALQNETEYLGFDGDQRSAGLAKVQAELEAAQATVGSVARAVEERELDATEWAALLAGLLGGGGVLGKLVERRVNKQRDAARVARNEPVGLVRKEGA